MDDDTALKILRKYTGDILNPTAVNKWLPTNRTPNGKDVGISSKVRCCPYLFRLIFVLFNFPVVLIWKFIKKPKVPENEFIGTFKFATGLVFFPIYFLLLFFLLFLFFTVKIALLRQVLLMALHVFLVTYALDKRLDYTILKTVLLDVYQIE